MADSTVSALTAASALDGTELYYGVQGGADRKVTGSQIKTLASASPTITGHATVEGVTATGATGTGKFVFDTSPTFTTGITIGAGSAITSSGAGGALGSNAFTSTAYAPAASPTITGHATIEGVTATGATGTGKFVFDTAPTLGAITVTSANKMAITAPATSSTLAVADGKTLTASNTLTLAGTDSTTMTFPPASASIGYLGVPINGQNAGYTCVLADAGKAILFQTAGTFTIPANASVAYPVGTVLTFINGSTSSTIPITSDTMTLVNSSTTGTRTLAANGIATAIKLTSTTWLISGTGLT